MKINNKIIIGLLGIILVTTGVALDKNLSTTPPNFIYANNAGYYYQGRFNYCAEQGSSCYLKENSYCIQEDIERCTPKICVSEIKVLEAQEVEMMDKEQENSHDHSYEQKSMTKECILSRIKSGEEIYIYDSKLQISTKATSVPEFVSSDWEYNYYDNSFFGNSTTNNFRRENTKYRANLPQNIEFISFIK